MKQVVLFILFSLLDLLIRPSKKQRPGSLLLVRMDAIGDYILFRNFIEVLKKDARYASCSITLLGNRAWQSIAETLDAEYVDRFIWIDRIRFKRDLLYRYRTLKSVSSQGYEFIISPVFSRAFFCEDSIVHMVSATKKIGSAGNWSNIRKWQKRIGDRYYTKLIPAEEGVKFEFDRNKEFFEKFLRTTIAIQKPDIVLKKRVTGIDLPETYAVLFLGASEPFRKWNVEKFAMLAGHLQQQYGYAIVLCGGPADAGDAKGFADFFHGTFIDLVGKTTLIELLYVIQGGEIMVANETSAPHMAVALDMKQVFVIYNGNHYGRFTPYPIAMTSRYHAVCHPAVQKDAEHYKRVSNAYRYVSSLDIDEIDVKTVIDRIDLVLQKGLDAGVS